VTDDNPRHEDPEQITTDIMQGFRDPNRVIVQHDRSKAIQDIIQCAVVGDCVLVAGKGLRPISRSRTLKFPLAMWHGLKSFCKALLPNTNK